MSLLRRVKKVIHRGSSSRGESSRSDTPSTPVHPDSTDDHDYCGTQQHPRQSFQESTQQVVHPDDGIWLIDEQGAPIRRRGRTTCADIQRMPPGTRVHIEINNNGVPCNIPESILLGSYLGVVVRDPMLAPLFFPDWHSKAMEHFKKKMLAEVESKFEFPRSIPHWILQSLAFKWRNYRTNLKAKHWNSRPIEKIMEAVPNGVDAAQWCHLVAEWSQPEDQEQACEFLDEEGLTSEDENLETNERMFTTIMGPEHPERVQTQGFEVTPTRYFPQSTSTTDSTNNASCFARVARLEEEMHSFRSEMRQFMQQFQMHFPPPGSPYMGDNAHSSQD